MENGIDVEITKGNHILKFEAEWCAPCRAYSPAFDEVSKSLSDKVQSHRVNVDEHPTLVERFSIKSIPTTVFIKEGVVDKTLTGKMTKEMLEEECKKTFQ